MSLGNLVANLGVNRKGWTSGLNGAKSDLGSFAGGVKKLLGPIAGIVGGTLAAGASIGAAQEQIKAEKKLAAVLKATAGAAGLSADEIGRFAASRQEITNFGDEATIAGAAVLGTFKNIKGDIFKDSLVAMQDMSTVMETDMKGGAIQLGKALNDPVAGIAALTRVGVTFTDQQKEQIKALQESGDMMGAQRVILSELKSQFGGAAEAAADPMTQMRNVVGDVAEIIGFVLLPTVNALSNAITGSVAPITGNVEAYKALGQSIADVVTIGIIPLAAVAKGAFELLTTGAGLFAYAINNAGDLSQLALINIADALLGLLPVSENTASSIVANLVAGFSGAKAFAMSFVDSVVGGLKEIWNVGKAVAKAIADAFDALVSGENPLEAFTASFIETLANQKDVQAPNIAAVMKDTFSEAKEQTLNSIQQSGGAGAYLDNQREIVNQRLAGRERPGETDLGELKVVIPDISVGESSSSDRGSKGINTALDARSSAGISAILKATQGGESDVQKKQATYLERIAKQNEQAAQREEEAQRIAARQKRPKVVKF